MKNLRTLALLCSVILLSSFDYPYNRLNTLYETNQEKCLKSASNMMHVFKNNPAPYYFTSLVYFDKAEKETNTRQKYYAFAKSLTYARKLEMLKNEAFLERVDWNSRAAEVEVLAEEIIKALDEENMDRFSAAISSKMGRLHWNEIAMNEEANIAMREESNATPLGASGAVVAANGNVTYFGMPSGTESILSYDLASEQEMLERINAERKKKKMEPLIWNEDLARAARYHAYDMGTQEYFDHASKDRKGFRVYKACGTFERIRQFYNETSVNSENIAAGNRGAEATYQQWYNSPGHYNNLFNANSRHVGIGVVFTEDSPYGYYWVFCTAL